MIVLHEITATGSQQEVLKLLKHPWNNESVKLNKKFCLSIFMRQFLSGFEFQIHILLLLHTGKTGWTLDDASCSQIQGWSALPTSTHVVLRQTVIRDS